MLPNGSAHLRQSHAREDASTEGRWTALLSAQQPIPTRTRHAAQLRQADEHDVRARTTNVRAQGHDAVRIGRRRRRTRSVRPERPQVRLREEPRRAADARGDAGRRRDAAFGSVIRHQLPDAAARRADAGDAQAAAGRRHRRQRGEDRRDLRQGRSEGRDHVHDAQACTRRRAATLLVTMGNVAFLRADGGFGGKSEGAPKPRPVPADRAAGSAGEYAGDVEPGAHLSPLRRLQPAAHRSGSRAQRRLRSADPARTRRDTAPSAAR